MDAERIRRDVARLWRESIVAELQRYIAIPCKSPHFDPDWERNGHIEAAVRQLAGWAESLEVPDLDVEVVRLPGRTPVLLLELPGTGEPGVLLYGHLDKQPEMSGWREGLGPWQPVREGDRLYGRGGADDGYALFAALAALAALAEQGVAHRRCIVLIEACEESGSFDLPHYLELLGPRIGRPELVVCLDSGCGDYDRLWATTSLRGMVSGTLDVEILAEGVHSGDASGIVPSSFRIARQLLERLEDATTGEIRLPACHAPIPAARVAQAREAAAILGEGLWRRFPLLAGARPMHSDPAELVLNRTWRPALSVTGAAGLPALADAGNVLRPGTALQLSLRLPPTANAARAAEAVKSALEGAPPCGARVEFATNWQTGGWEAPPPAPWLTEAVESASQAFFGAPPAWMGEGGTIPFMAMLGEAFPEAQFLITGVLGPQSNAHGPNEFLHLPCAESLTCCVAGVLAAHGSGAAGAPGPR